MIKQQQLSRFILGKYEVTQEFYRAVMENAEVLYEGLVYNLQANPSCFSNNDLLRKDEVQKLCPVDSVSWYDAIFFCNRLSELLDLEKAYDIENITIDPDYRHISNADVFLNENANGFRLPFLKEWEFAARGGDTSSPEWNYCFSGADSIYWVESTNTTRSSDKGIDLIGWYIHNTCSEDGTTKLKTFGNDKIGYGTHEVGKKNSNSSGLFDMSGNVEEWCFDKTPDNKMAIASGGSFCYGAIDCQNISKKSHSLKSIYFTYGFRLCRSYIPEN